MTTSPQSFGAGDQLVVLDGGLATELESRGHDLSSDLWSARLLAQTPDEIRAVHRSYFSAGAQVATTASYQASYEGLAAAGYDATATDRLLQRSVELARQAAGDEPDHGTPRWVAASVGPYGAMLAHGEEYTGDYGPDVGVPELRQWHRRRLEVLASAEPDLLALETIPSLAEAEALLAEVADLGVPAWLSLTCEGLRTRRGEDVLEAFDMAEEVSNVVAVGVNCSAPHDVEALVAAAAGITSKAIVAYPNSGEAWDADERQWHGDPGFTISQVTSWLDAGARMIGGCCRVGPDQIRALAAIRKARPDLPVR